MWKYRQSSMKLFLVISWESFVILISYLTASLWISRGTNQQKYQHLGIALISIREKWLFGNVLRMFGKMKPTCSFTKKWHCYRCFSVNLAIFLRTFLDSTDQTPKNGCFWLEASCSSHCYTKVHVRITASHTVNQ